MEHYRADAVPRFFRVICCNRTLESVCTVLGTLNILLRIAHYLILKIVLFFAAFITGFFTAKGFLYALGFIVPDFIVILADIVLIIGALTRGSISVKTFLTCIGFSWCFSLAFHTFLLTQYDVVEIFILELIVLTFDVICFTYGYYMLKNWRDQDSSNFVNIVSVYHHKDVPAAEQNDVESSEMEDILPKTPPNK